MSFIEALIVGFLIGFGLVFWYQSRQPDPFERQERQIVEWAEPEEPGEVEKLHWRNPKRLHSGADGFTTLGADQDYTSIRLGEDTDD